MASFSTFIERFRRITYSGRYMPEVDGLRFIAIFLVVCVVHLSTYIIDGVFADNRPGEWLRLFFIEGGYGVSLFFMISGFILSLPFAEQYLLNKKKVELKGYFFRRLTRLEPAYVITLVLYFIMRAWVLHYTSFAELLPHFFASLFYVHNFVYDAHSTINGVAWSLEVEVQFYILAPLLAGIYLLKNTIARRIIFCIVIIGGTVFSFVQRHEVPNLLNMGCYFVAGMLLSDLYLLRKKEWDGLGFTLLALLCLIISLFIPSYQLNAYYCVLKIILVTAFFFFAITNATLKKCLSIGWVAVIGGMCYSIYLLHEGVLGLLRHSFVKVAFTGNQWLDAILHYTIATLLILIVSSIFFLLIEKPTMRRDWYKKIFAKKSA